MKKPKHYYYVGVPTKQGMKLVTKITKDWAEWNDNEKPLQMKKFDAEDVATGLNFNFIFGVVIQSNVEIETQLFKAE